MLVDLKLKFTAKVCKCLFFTGEVYTHNDFFTCFRWKRKGLSLECVCDESKTHK